MDSHDLICCKTPLGFLLVKTPKEEDLMLVKAVPLPRVDALCSDAAFVFGSCGKELNEVALSLPVITGYQTRCQPLTVF